ncbi:MAG: LysR family transcriptional regulator, partial [Rhodospirillales bacterium]|nr:LysR family transcriptional regulator [Acetobacter sp.]
MAEALSFHGAARRLHVTQPSLGRQVRDLEKEIGAQLFERNRRHVMLTDAGRVFLPKARELLAGAEAAAHMAREAQKGLRGSLHIGNIGILSAAFLPDSLAEFRKHYPQVEIEVRELLLEEQVAALRDGTIQVG